MSMPVASGVQLC